MDRPTPPRDSLAVRPRHGSSGACTTTATEPSVARTMRFGQPRNRLQSAVASRTIASRCQSAPAPTRDDVPNDGTVNERPLPRTASAARRIWRPSNEEDATSAKTRARTSRSAAPPDSPRGAGLRRLLSRAELRHFCDAVDRRDGRVYRAAGGAWTAGVSVVGPKSESLTTGVVGLVRVGEGAQGDRPGDSGPFGRAGGRPLIPGSLSRSLAGGQVRSTQR